MTDGGVEALQVLVDRARAGDGTSLAALMQRHNQRLFRIARAIVRNDADAEDIVQDAFVKAFTGLDGLREADSIGPWLAKITANLALTRIRQMTRRDQVLSDHSAEVDTESESWTPERHLAMDDVRKLLEASIDRLGDGFREVFVLRAVEQMSVEETAAALDIRPETVKTRLHRARTMLRADLRDHLTAVSLKAFPFAGARCARTTEAVLARLRDAVPCAPAVSTAPRSHH
jgi:RNA polymerase sigma-70 factor (ECF subfamily)